MIERERTIAAATAKDSRVLCFDTQVSPTSPDTVSWDIDREVILGSPPRDAALWPGGTEALDPEASGYRYLYVWNAAYNWFLPLGPLGVFESAARQFAAMVERACGSARVYAKVTDGVADLWVVLPERDDRLERSVAEGMCEVMRGHPHLRFDFMLVDDDCELAQETEESGYLLVSPHSAQ